MVGGEEARPSMHAGYTAGASGQEDATSVGTAAAHSTQVELIVN